MPWPAFNFPAASGLAMEQVIANKQMEAGMRYNLNSAGSLDMTLPLAVNATSNDIIEIISEKNTGGFVVKQNADQLIRFLNTTTTPGTGGTLTLNTSSGVLKGSVTLICTSDDGLEWVAYPSGGNLTAA